MVKGDAAVEGDEGYLVKRIMFGLLPVHVVLQEGDGPCPLLAIVNVLLLRGVIRLPSGSDGWVSHGTLVRVLCDYAMETNKVLKSANAEQRANIEANLHAGLKVLTSASMRRGMLVNPSLTRVDSFEFTSEMGVFDLFRIRLLHGWLIEPDDAPSLHEFFKDRSYNQIQDAISYTLHTASSAVSREGEDSYDDEVSNSVGRTSSDGTVEQADLARAWFAQHSSQLTKHGVTKLEESVGMCEVAVLWRNSHFSAMVKHEGKVYTLISAAAYWEHSRYVFQRVAVLGRNFGAYDGSFRAASA